MKKGNIIALIFLILSAFGIGVFLILPLISILILIASTDSIPSIGIIGGADGPTAVFVAGSTGGGALVPAIFGGLILAIIIVAVVIIVKKNREE